MGDIFIQYNLAFSKNLLACCTLSVSMYCTGLFMMHCDFHRAIRESEIKFYCLCVHVSYDRQVNKELSVGICYANWPRHYILAGPIYAIRIH